MRKEVNATYGPLTQFVTSIPERFESDGVVLFKGRNTIKRFDASGIPIVVKRFCKPIFIQRVIYTFFRHSKAQRAYDNGLRLQQLGFSTPESIAFLETKSSGLMDYAYYVCTVEDAPPIRRRLNDPEEFDHVMAADLAHFLVSLHEKGVLHDDFNSTNVLYLLKADGHYTFSLIDNNRMHFLSGMPPLADCMENMTRFTRKIDLLEYVAREYVAIRQLPPDTLERILAQKLRHDANRVRRKKFTRLLKRWFVRNA